MFKRKRSEEKVPEGIIKGEDGPGGEAVKDGAFVPIVDPTVWAEKFENSDHNHFIRMSASAMQEAMNIAARSGNVEHLLQCAQSWGTLATTVKELSKPRPMIGFNSKEEEDG